MSFVSFMAFLFTFTFSTSCILDERKLFRQVNITKNEKKNNSTYHETFPFIFSFCQLIVNNTLQNILSGN